MLQQLEEALKPHLEDECNQFIELSDIKHIKDTIYEVNWMAKRLEETSYSPISWFGKRLDLKDLIRDNKLKSLLGEELLDLNINIYDIRESKGLKCGNERLAELKKLYDVERLEELKRQYKS